MQRKPTQTETRAQDPLHKKSYKHPPEDTIMPSHKHSSSSKRTPHRMSHHTFSHYPDEQLLHFYRWTSPPGVMKILSIIIIIMCVAVFACVASTLAWDYDMDGMGLGSLGMGMGGSYGTGYNYGSNMYGGGIGSGSYGYGGGYNGGYGGYYMDPTTGKGFIIAISAITFFTVLVIFILVVSRQNTTKSSRFYLATIIICAILALLMLIASVVYLVAVNPMAQGSGSMMYNMIWQLCAQYQNQPQTSGLFINQYMYRYCVVEPQEAIAIVLGFLVGIGLIILMVFAIRTRSQMNRYGRHRVLWEEPRSLNDGFSHGVEKWVTDVSGEPEAYVNGHNDHISSRNYLDQTMDTGKPLYLPGDSDTTSTTIVLKSRTRDYDTGAESADELDDTDYDSEFPPIVKESERVEYKREFDRDLMEYKRLQAELDDINTGLAEVDRELDGLQEGSPQFLDAMEEYSRLKNLKRSSEYQMKKKRSKQLKAKLALLKRRVNDYDRRP
ncbi:occludin b isoform X1 [Pangasianodon hypophthalmus]|uniref:occludin b isoform X1 n=1 Tax=Pangasianodon hypophthalmus TaxID=310915 RepID=UPI00147B9C9C|nr:occludin b isoform X1 [Pangasianodon hypophthalmus]